MAFSQAFRFDAIGTQWTITLADGSTTAQKAAMAAVRARLDTFDQHYSRFRPDSLVAAMARRAGAYKLPADAQPMLDLYQELYRLTDGAMTPLVGRLLEQAGYDTEYSFRPQALQPPPDWSQLIDYAFPKLSLREPALLDFGAIGKGYAVDIVAAVLTEHGHRQFTINAGGDLLHHGPALRVGLEHPDHPEQAIGVARLTQGSLCGSAPNRRRWAGYHHIIDPHRLGSPHHIRAVWVTAATARLADGLSTALFFVSPARLASRFEFEYAIVDNTYHLSHSAAFPAEFFTSSEIE